MRFIPTRFSIRGLLLLSALIAVLLAWRLRKSESQVVAAVNDAGGKVTFGFKLDYVIQCSSNAFVVQNSRTEPPRKLSELVFGDCDKRCIQAIELPISSITPELVDKLMTLRHLKCLIVEIPRRPAFTQNKLWALSNKQRLIAIKSAYPEFGSKLDQLHALLADDLMFHCVDSL